MKTLLHISILAIFLVSPFTGLSDCQWTQKASFGGDARHRCTGFSIGNKGYIGGGHINSGVEITHEDYWQYDPGTDSWTQIADFGGGKRYQSTAFTIGEFAYVGMGEDDQDAYFNDFYRYVPQLNIWQPIASYPGHPRRGASAFVLGEFGYVGTGQSDFGYLDDFYKYDPVADDWYPVANFLGEERSSAVAFSYNGKGYLGTGHIFGDDTRDFYSYDPLTDTWEQLADVGTVNRQDATGFAVGGYGYIGTGNDVDATNDYKDFWRYDFETDTWEQFNDFCGEGRRYMVSFVIGETAYAGTGTDGTNMKDFWSFDPLLSANKNQLATIQVYPNPTTDFITIECGIENYKLEIFSLSGQLAFSEIVNNSMKTFNTSSFDKGSYLYRITSDGSIIKQDKIIVL
ncbi:MAG: kelch repeat-containing protein [Crocinitomicaceae bacterium]